MYTSAVPLRRALCAAVVLSATWIVQAWLASAPHRRVLLSLEYAELGVGVVADAPKPTLLPSATYTMDLGVIR